MMKDSNATTNFNGMTQEEKDLVLYDLCARLPYGVIVDRLGRPRKLIGIYPFKEYCFILDNGDYMPQPYTIEDVKPYLRPMSSMTEEERKEFIKYAGYEIEESVNGRHYEYYLKDFCGTPNNPSVNADSVDWLNKKMFDFRGLIPKGHAIAVTEENNPYKE